MTVFNRFTPVVKAIGVRIQGAADSDTSKTPRCFHITPAIYPIGFFGRVITAFAGLTRPSVELGITGDTTRYMQKQRIDVAGTLFKGTAGNIIDAKRGNDTETYGGAYGFCTRMDQELQATSAYNIIATLRLGSGSFSGYTAGEVEFVMLYIDATGSNY
jgi:hypothetical protein